MFFRGKIAKAELACTKSNKFWKKNCVSSISSTFWPLFGNFLATVWDFFGRCFWSFGRAFRPFWPWLGLYVLSSIAWFTGGSGTWGLRWGSVGAPCDLFGAFCPNRWNFGVKEVGDAPMWLGCFVFLVLVVLCFGVGCFVFLVVSLVYSFLSIFVKWCQSDYTVITRPLNAGAACFLSAQTQNRRSPQGAAQQKIFLQFFFVYKSFPWGFQTSCRFSGKILSPNVSLHISTSFGIFSWQNVFGKSIEIDQNFPKFFGFFTKIFIVFQTFFRKN